MTHVFMFAGELSGDMHGGRLLRALKTKMDYRIATGVGGPNMRAQGLAGSLSMEDFDVMGFSDVLWELPRLRKQFNQLRDYILDTSPDVSIFVDSPSFSLRMARKLRQDGYKGKIVQYICPTVWAWGKHRIGQMADTLDLLLTIYPFEADLFTNTSLKVQYVGNPLQEVIREHRYDSNWQKLFGIKKTQDLIALFPGSRTAEIGRNLPKQLEAVKLLQKEHPGASFAISCAHEHNMELVQKILRKSQLKQNRDVFFVPRIYSYDLMRTCRSAIAKSGTVTMELMLHKCPTVVVYELTTLNRLIAKYILRLNLPHYCIVNILAGKRVYPELIESGFNPENLYHHLKSLHIDGPSREQCISECQNIHALLKEENASELAAGAIVNLL